MKNKIKRIVIRYLGIHKYIEISVEQIKNGYLLNREYCKDREELKKVLENIVTAELK